MADLGDWNYAIGFGAIMVGLALSAHPSTPLGRGRGVVIGMLGCFLIGLLWICTFYVFSNNIDSIPVFNDLGQFNLVVGIAFMAVGFYLRHSLGMTRVATFGRCPGCGGFETRRVAPSLRSGLRRRSFNLRR